MIRAINVFTADQLDGRLDVGSAAESSETAMYIYDIAPGKSSSPYHYEYAEEWLLVVDGTVTVRAPDGEHTLDRGDLVRFPAGPAGAHKIMNKSDSPARTLVFSDSRPPAVSVYPDSNKIAGVAGKSHRRPHLRPSHRGSLVTRRGRLEQGRITGCPPCVAQAPQTKTSAMAEEQVLKPRSTAAPLLGNSKTHAHVAKRKWAASTRCRWKRESHLPRVPGARVRPGRDARVWVFRSAATRWPRGCSSLEETGPTVGRRSLRRGMGVLKWRQMHIYQLTLASCDLPAQSAFWGTVLALPVQLCDDGGLEVRLQSSTIRFEHASPGTDPRYHFAINVPAHSIVEAAAWITDRHRLLAFHGDPDEEEGATVVHTDRGASALYFLDAGGNVVELISSPYLDRHADGPFGAGSLLEIAEIGIATATVHATRSAIQQTFETGVLWGGREGSLLTAIGDDHGVVIVAPIGRGWIPIGLPARPLPTKVIAAGPRARKITLHEGPYELRAIARS